MKLSERELRLAMACMDTIVERVEPKSKEEESTALEIEALVVKIAQHLSDTAQKAE